MADEVEDGMHHDDGFDSEATTLTPASSSGSRNEYYNSLEHIWVKQKLIDNFSKAKPTRVNSESIGSLSSSDHDYYNEIQLPVTSDSAFLEKNGTATSVV